MQPKKSFIIAGVVTALGIVSVLSLSAGSAHAAATGHTSLIDRLAQRFNLNKADVQSVFDEDRAEHMAQRAQSEQDRIAQAVQDGKLTQAQADLLTAKRAEVKTFMNSLKDKTPAERASAMKTEMDSLKTWATDNNIPMQFVGPFGFKHHGMGMGFHHNDNDGDDK